MILKMKYCIYKKYHIENSSGKSKIFSVKYTIIIPDIQFFPKKFVYF